LDASDLSALLWQERALLDQLLLNLETQAFLPQGDSESGLPLLREQLENIIERLRLVELARSVELSSLAKEWKVPENFTLGGLAASAPTGVWTQILEAHLAAMTSQALLILGLQKSIEDLPHKTVRLTREKHKKRTGPLLSSSTASEPKAATDADDAVVMQQNFQTETPQGLGEALPGTLQEFLGLSALRG
jgi:hypothetical protein